MSPPTLCVITGPDGTGKTTLVSALVRALNHAHGDGHATTVRIWDSLADLLSVEQARRYLATVGHRSRATLLLHGISRALDLGEAAGAQVLVIDGYWYKYMVSELAHGTSPAVFAGCAEAFPTPDLAVYLDLPIEVALARKTGISDYERGLDAEAGTEAQAFVAFQERMQSRWAAIEADVGPWVHLSSTQPVETLVDAVLARLPAARP